MPKKWIVSPDTDGNFNVRRKPKRGVGASWPEAVCAKQENAVRIVAALNASEEESDADAAAFVALYRLQTAFAKHLLAEANRENSENGDPDQWPAQQSWNDLVGSSHSIFLRKAREEAGIDDVWYKKKLELYSEYVAEIYEEAAKRA